jgi:hypothetical protein
MPEVHTGPMPTNRREEVIKPVANEKPGEDTGHAALGRSSAPGRQSHQPQQDDLLVGDLGFPNRI